MPSRQDARAIEFQLYQLVLGIFCEGQGPHERGTTNFAAVVVIKIIPVKLLPILRKKHCFWAAITGIHLSFHMGHRFVY